MGGKGIDLEVKAVFPGEMIHLQQVDLIRTGDANDGVSLPRTPPVHRVIFAGETEFQVIMPLPAPSSQRAPFAFQPIGMAATTRFNYRASHMN